jgi:hypothetical protein
MVGTTKVMINRAPVLTLWAAVVAERLGYDRDAALTLGRSVAGINAKSKALAIGRIEPPSPAEAAKRRRETKRDETIEIELLGRVVRAKRTADGLRATERGRPANPAAVQRYLESKFGDALPAVRAAMKTLAASRTPSELAGDAFSLYEDFRPKIPPGMRGWGAAGELDLDLIRALAKRRTLQAPRAALLSRRASPARSRRPG